MITDTLPKTIGQRVEKAFPQDTISEGVYVRIGHLSRRVLEVVSFDAALDRLDVETGRVKHGSEWVVPHCFECGQPKLDEPSILCRECNHVYAGIFQDEFS